ncbi:hypothetical protein JYT29_02550 [Nitrospina gracilis]|nr:hypothetical protein [Nitrospina gracilis]
MMTLISKLLLPLSAFIFFTMFFAQPPLADSLPLSNSKVCNLANETNGCGPQGWGLLVPDKMPISGCKFNSSCKLHDLCYGKCLCGGTLYRDSSCPDLISKEKRRKICDTTFKKDIENENPGRSLCGFYASIYAWAVSTGGGGSFNGKEIEEFMRYLDKNPDHQYDLKALKKDFYESIELKTITQAHRFNFSNKNSGPKISIYRKEGRQKIIINSFENQNKIKFKKPNSLSKDKNISFDRDQIKTLENFNKRLGTQDSLRFR